MAALAAERGYALSCGRLGRGTRVSVFHVKLTESALSAFEAYQGRKESVALRPSIQFQGSQGHISIPRPDCPTEARTFSFYLSNIGKDSPQGSFDCIQQYVSSDGNIQLDCLGTIQDKITVCATDDSYQKAKQNMALAESDLRSRGAIVIKPGGRYVGKKVQMRKPAPGASDTVPSRIRPTPVNLASAIKKSNSAVSQRPFRDRVMHLLALKPYKKPELILRLQKDRLSPPDKDSLDVLLQQVANVNAKDSTCTLKDHLYREVQKDWPGYTESDRLLLKKILSRKPCPPQNTSCPPETPALSPPKDQANVSSSSPQKRPQPPEFTDPLAHKRPRISRFAQRTQATFNGKLGSANGREASPSPAVEVVSSSTLLPPLELPRPHDPLTDVSNDLSHNGKDSEEPAGRLGAPGAPRPADSASAGRHHGGTHSKSKKKLKKHRERERKQQEEEQQQAREKPHCEPKKGGPKTGPLQDATAGLNGACNSSSVLTSTSEMPDYLLKYAAISSSEQRQSYKNDFNAEYSEYRDLHARIERITRRFTQLDSQLKQLSQGSEEYKTIHDQILQEYRKIKKTNPNYSQEKNRCEYLHNKLAHIKKLIAEYDHQQF
ncbi:RNA polymerase II elongation factor ELL [Hemicordylus capensis]|uniref:RNA polymerase II elongation factor ELL n=1 Tax=Hemicordylus capensis TaxID=884348 RepID=UPI00230389C9|nr:RNA polymerase II elongation factor ELL [Hemicordylus capensis]